MSKRIFIKNVNITQNNYNYLVNYGLCKQHKNTLSFNPIDYHLYFLSGYFNKQER